MRGVAIVADAISGNRVPLPKDHPLVEKERELSGQVSRAIKNARKVRDSTYEHIFSLLYGTSANNAPTDDRRP
jgi:hypothetical protein